MRTSMLVQQALCFCLLLLLLLLLLLQQLSYLFFCFIATRTGRRFTFFILLSDLPCQHFVCGRGAFQG